MRTNDPMEVSDRLDDPVAHAREVGITFTDLQAKWLSHHLGNALLPLRVACDPYAGADAETMQRWILAAVARIAGVLAVIREAGAEHIRVSKADIDQTRERSDR